MALDLGGIAGTGVSLQQVAGQAAGMDKLVSNVAGMLSPTGKIVDTLGSALNLPDPIKHIAKLALGVGTGDIAGIISGAFGLAATVMEELAKTQYQPPADPMKAGEGYAAPRLGCAPRPPPGHCPPPSPSPPPCGPPRVDPELLKEKKALETLLRDFGAIDNAGGFWFPDGRFSGLDMTAVARGDFPPEMKEAVRYLQAHPDKFCRMDVSDGFDGLVSRAGLSEALCRVNAEIGRQQGAHPASPASPGGATGSEPASPPAPGGGSLEGRLLSRLGAAQQEVDALTEQALQNPDDQQLQLKLQKAQQRMRSLFEMVSNMLKQDHEMRMTALQNTK